MSSSSTRISNQVDLRLLKGSNSSFTRDGGEVVKKLFQRVTTFDVVNEGLHGNARADNTGVPPRMSVSEQTTDDLFIEECLCKILPYAYNALTISSVIFLASPNSIMVLSR